MPVKVSATARNAEEALKAAAFDLAADATFIVAPDCIPVAANAAAEALFGHSLAGLIREGATPLSPVAALVDRCFRAETPVRAHSVEIALPSREVFSGRDVAVALS